MMHLGDEFSRLSTLPDVAKSEDDDKRCSFVVSCDACSYDKICPNSTSASTSKKAA